MTRTTIAIASITTTIAIVVIAFLAAAFLTTTMEAEEDSAFFNCYLSGNHECGNAPHILGYVITPPTTD